MMTRLIYLLIEIISKFHTKIMSINDSHGIGLTDKQLHFLVIGVIGFAMLLVIQPLFEWFAKKDGVLFISFAYVFTVIMVITFAIEIGQGYAGTGDMDFKDILSGILGFFVFFGIYLICYIVYKKYKESKTEKKDN